MKKLKVKVHLVEDVSIKSGYALYKTRCQGKDLYTTTKINFSSIGLNIVFSINGKLIATSVMETESVKIPMTFVNKFIKVYGGTNTIKEALVSCTDDGTLITRTDGTCIVSRIKDTFTRAEFINAIKGLSKYGKDLTGDKIDDYINSLTT